MRFTVLKYTVCLYVCLYGLSTMAEGGVTASENEAAKAEAPSEEKAGAGGGSGADKEWAKRRTKLNVYETRISESTKELQHLIHLKNSGQEAKDEKGNAVDVIEKITSEHRKLLGNVKEYNVEREELKYRFPEEGALIERRYMPMRELSLIEIEKDLGLDGELTKTKAKIDKKYEPFVGQKLKKKRQRWDEPESTLKEKSPHGQEPEAPERLRLKK